MSAEEKGRIKQQEITDDFVRQHAVPADEAESYVHVGLDFHYHPTGGYWFPTGQTWGDSTGWVSQKSEIGVDDLIQYPRDDRLPEIVGKDELPDWVVNRVVTNQEETEA